MRLLILGASGMLGNNLFQFFLPKSEFETFAVVRNKSSLGKLYSSEKVLEISHIENKKELNLVLKKISPKVVINCLGAIKQKNDLNNSSEIIYINSLLPHLLEDACIKIGARLIHFSTDCVYSGKLGNYVEENEPDAQDLYGLSKRLGEISNENSLTLRTSIIGHELNSKLSLIDWFLSQENKVKGYKKAIFSGLTTIEIGKVLEKIVFPNHNLSGLFHLSVNPINKYDLLKLVAKEYKKNIKILEDSEIKIDRSLDSSKFSAFTGYNPPSWKELVKELHDFYDEKFKK